jgi:RNA recognition motif-containing protein
MIKKLQARGEARKGRGFGFVTLASEELQQKAVNEMNGKEIEGREIAVKVAIDSPDKTDEEQHEGDATNGQKDAAPATEATPAAAPAPAGGAEAAVTPAAATKTEATPASTTPATTA